MGTTAAGLRYPEPTDRVADGATAMLNLATDVGALARARLLVNAGPTGELTTPAGPDVWADVLTLDYTAPASIHAGAAVIVWCCGEGMWTGGAGGPKLRWLRNGTVVGQPRNFDSRVSNAYDGRSTVVIDYLTAPTAGSAVTLRLQHASGSSIVCRTRTVVGGALLV